MKNQYALFILLGSLLLSAALKAQGERITHYDVTIEVNRDASLSEGGLLLPTLQAG